MLAIQVSIGALNDLVDAPLDALAEAAASRSRRGWSRRRRGARGRDRGGRVGLVAVGAVGAGDRARGRRPASASGTPTTCGCRGRRCRGCRSSLALPLLPIHAWLGATGAIPPGLRHAGARRPSSPGSALALANGLVDVERDRATGRPAIAVRLGRGRAWLVQTPPARRPLVVLVLLAIAGDPIGLFG